MVRSQLQSRITDGTDGDEGDEGAGSAPAPAPAAAPAAATAAVDAGAVDAGGVVVMCCLVPTKSVVVVRSISELAGRDGDSEVPLLQPVGTFHVCLKMSDAVRWHA